MSNNKDFSQIFCFRSQFGNVRWTKGVIEVLKNNGITVTEAQVRIANKKDGQVRHREEIRAAIKKVYSSMDKTRTERIEAIEAN